MSFHETTETTRGPIGRTHSPWDGLSSTTPRLRTLASQMITRTRLGFIAAMLMGAAFFALNPSTPPVAAEPKAAPAAECRWADSPIVLDGTDDDPAWKHAQVIDTFGQPWLGDAVPPLRGTTRAKLLWDRDYLYFFADMDDSDLFADVTDHDGPVAK